MVQLEFESVSRRVLFDLRDHAIRGILVRENVNELLIMATIMNKDLAALRISYNALDEFQHNLLRENKELKEKLGLKEKTIVKLYNDLQSVRDVTLDEAIKLLEADVKSQSATIENLAESHNMLSVGSAQQHRLGTKAAIDILKIFRLA